MQRFLAISDIHRRDRVKAWALRLVRDEGLDGVFVLGDITHFGPPSWAAEFLQGFGVPVYAVPGNCDPPGTTSQIERSATLLHARRVETPFGALVGYGGSNPTIFNTPSEFPEEQILRELRPAMTRGAILVVHCPPYGINDVTFSGQNAGSEAILHVVTEFRPRAVLSGHIHEAFGVVERDGTVFINPGAAKDGRAAIVTLEGRPRAELLDGLE
jgi:Icc-related predicted phosphoesterase